MLYRRILVLVPHPDDEAVGAALALRRARAAGVAAYAIDLTHGVPPRERQFPWARGAEYDRRVDRRRTEARAAASALHVTRIGDDGLPARRLRQALPQAFARILAAIDQYRIEALWVPAYEGAHPDHDCANALAEAVRRRRPQVECWEFAEYNNAGGRTNANTFIAEAGPEQRILPADEDEKRWKAAVLGLYQSEQANLRNIGSDMPMVEAFRRLPAYDYDRPPHSGRLFYERFHWVPFRHPAIDFTRSAEVSAAIGTVLAGLAPDAGPG